MILLLSSLHQDDVTIPGNVCLTGRGASYCILVLPFRGFLIIHLNIKILTSVDTIESLLTSQGTPYLFFKTFLLIAMTVFPNHHITNLVQAEHSSTYFWEEMICHPNSKVYILILMRNAKQVHSLGCIVRLQRQD